MDNLDFALQVFVLGFTVVIFTLFVLFFVLSLFGKIFYHPPKIKESSDLTAGSQPAPEQGIDTLPPKVVAAVTAAVSAYMQSDNQLLMPLTVNVQRRSSAAGSNWTADGRRLLLNSRNELERLRRKSLRERV